VERVDLVVRCAAAAPLSLSSHLRLVVVGPFWFGRVDECSLADGDGAREDKAKRAGSSAGGQFWGTYVEGFWILDGVEMFESISGEFSVWQTGSNTTTLSL
jgi:hypothetical protein